MKFCIIFLYAFFFTNFAIGQKHYLNEYPFNEAVSIKLISYSNSTAIPNSPNYKSMSCFSIPQNSWESIFDIDFTKLDSIKTINFEQVVKLSQIAYGEMSEECKNDNSSATDCSDVKQGFGILFFNEENDVFAIIDFCFECKLWTRSWPIFNPLCQEKVDLIKEFFINNGFIKSSR